MSEKAELLSPFPGMDPYVRAIDYSRPPEPPLSEADAAWADERLRLAGLRE